METNREVLESKDLNGNVVKVAIVFPVNKDIQDAQMAYNIKLAELIRKGASGKEQLLSRNQLENYLNTMGLWTTEDQVLFGKLQSDIRNLEKKLKNGGIKLSEARKMAINMKISRNAMLNLYNKRIQFDESTMEAVAENHRFKFLMVRCVVNSEDGSCLYKNIDDYTNKSNEQYSIDAAKILAARLFGYKNDYEVSLPENKWLKTYGFTNEDGHFIDKDGKLIDMMGRKVNKDGRYINDNGDYVDVEGNPVDENGEFIIKETQPFLDDITGEPIKVE